MKIDVFKCYSPVILVFTFGPRGPFLQRGVEVVSQLAQRRARRGSLVVLLLLLLLPPPPRVDLVCD